jgi:uncharacterized protein (DUF1501 family)
VIVSLRGGADALNLLVPHGDPDYRRLRPSLAIPSPKKGAAGASGTGAAAAIDLDGFFGFHPALAPLVPLWERRELAAVAAVGWPGVSHSHFEAWEEIECGAVGDERPSSGWLARALASRPPRSPLRAVAFADTTPRLLTGALGATVLQSLEDLALVANRGRGDAVRGALTRLYGESRFPLGASGLEVLDALRALERASGTSAAASARRPPGLPRALADVARLVRADVGLEAASVEIGGWDFHFAEGGSSGAMAGRLAELAQAIADFRRDVGEHWARIRLVAISEFGRRVAENASGGTDHGQAGAFLVAGGAVRGGRVYGRWPGLSPDRLASPGDLAITTDFRSVLSEALPEDTSAIERQRIFPGFAPEGHLGLFRPHPGPLPRGEGADA